MPRPNVNQRRDCDKSAHSTPLLAAGDQVGFEPGWPGAALFKEIPVVEVECFPFCIIQGFCGVSLLNTELCPFASNCEDGIFKRSWQRIKFDL